MRECDKRALFKIHPECHPDCVISCKFYVVTAVELLVNI